MYMCVYVYALFYILCSTLYTISVLSSPPAHVISVAMYTDGSLVADCGFTDNIVQGPVCVCVCVCVCVGLCVCVCVCVCVCAPRALTFLVEVRAHNYCDCSRL